MPRIHRAILMEMPFGRIALWGRILGTIAQALDGRIVHATLTKPMLDETGTEQHDADGVVEFMARSNGAEVVLLLRELGPLETRVSVRTTPSVDATAIAAAFGGGGHTGRAGCTVPRSAAEAARLVVTMAEQQIASSRRG